MRRMLPFIPAMAFAAVVGQNWVTEHGGSAITDAKGSVTAVSFRGSWISDADLHTLVSLPALAKLDLSHTRITDIGFQGLKEMRGVTHLDLYYAEQIGDGVLSVVKNWRNLRRINVRGTTVTDAGVAHLVGHPSLESIDVGFSLFTDNGFEHLAAIPNLKEIAVGGNKVTDVGLNSLRLMPNLVAVDLSGSQRTDSGLWAATITDRGLETLAVLTRLERLNLRNSKISDVGFAKLSSLPLRDLNLAETQLSATGLAALPALSKLERLSLWKCKRVEDDAIESIAGLKQLRWLDVKGTKLTAAGIARLRASLPQCRVEAD